MRLLERKSIELFQPFYFSLVRPMFTSNGLLELKALRGGSSGGTGSSSSNDASPGAPGHVDGTAAALGNGDLLGIHNPIYDVQVTVLGTMDGGTVEPFRANKEQPFSHSLCL